MIDGYNGFYVFSSIGLYISLHGFCSLFIVHFMMLLLLMMMGLPRNAFRAFVSVFFLVIKSCTFFHCLFDAALIMAF